jgi:hypothetical protein
MDVIGLPLRHLSFKLLLVRWRQNHRPQFRSSIGAGGRRAVMYFDEHLHRSVMLRDRAGSTNS